MTSTESTTTAENYINQALKGTTANKKNKYWTDL